MTATWINHQLKRFIPIGQRVYQLDGVLHMHIVIDIAVQDAQSAFILIYISQHRALTVSFRVILGGIHIPLGIMCIIEFPAGHGSPGNNIVEIIRRLGHRHARHVAAIAVSGDQQLVVSYPRLTLGPFRGSDVVDDFPMPEVTVHERHPLLTEMTGGTVIHTDLYNAFIGPMLTCSTFPGILYRPGIGPTVNTENDGMGLRFIEIRW